jgi:hypothetical protein
VNPKRIQRQRAKGWRLADHSTNAVYVGRGSRWGNPYRVGQDGAVVGGALLYGKLDHTAATWAFKHALYWGLLPYTVEDVRRELAGKDLVCWCSLSSECHATVLLEAAGRRAAA